MLTNIQRVRLYSLSIIVVVIILAIFFGISSSQRLADVRTLSEARNFSYALERFKQQFWRYPVGKNIDIRTGVTLTENGFAPGSAVVFYRGGIPSSRAVTYDGTDDSYTISFGLHKTWPQQGITSTKCTIRENFNLKCTK